MVADAGGAPTSADPAKGETVDPEAPKEPATLDPPKSAPLGRWPWIVTALLTAVVLLLFFTYIDRAWDYVIARDEIAEKEDWDQLSTLVGRVDALVTLVLGAILGVGLGAAKGAGDAKAATAVADGNKKEAERQHVTATINAKAAASNRAAAKAVHHDLGRARTSLRNFQTVSRGSTTTGGARIGGHAAGGSPSGQGGQYRQPATSAYPNLDSALAEASDLCDELDQKYG